MTTLQLHSISKYFGGKEIFRDVSFHLSSGHRLALVGPNGSGKSTLLQIIYGNITPNQGQVKVAPSMVGVGFGRQELRKSDLENDLLTWILNSLPGWSNFWTKWNQALEKEDNLRLNELAQYQTYLEQIYGYNPEHQAENILLGLGFDQSQFYQPIIELSGGWREKVKLARALMQGTDILLLDEPTNHLDLQTVRWLENFLINFKGILIFVAHDRMFLDRVSNRILYLGKSKPIFRRGNFSSFICWQEQQKNFSEKQIQNLDQQITQKKRFVNRFRYKASKAKLAQSKLKQIQNLEVEKQKYVTEENSKQLTFHWPQPKRCNYEVLHAEDLQFSLDSDTKILWSRLNFNIYRGQKIGLVGPNGCGKSTLLRIIIGELEPKGGSIRIGPSVQVGYFAQHLSDILREDNSVLTEVRRLSASEVKENELRTVLGLFLLGQEYTERKVADLSGGEKNRLMLASLFLAKANFLILDEPTNHLDLDSREALIEALKQFSGTVLVVSHDRYLLQEVVEELWELNQDIMNIIQQRYDQYEKEILQSKESNGSVSKTQDPTRQKQKVQRRQVAEKRNHLYRELKSLKENYAEFERELENNLVKQAEIEERLADPSTYTQNEKIGELNKSYQELKILGESLLYDMEKLENKIKTLEDAKKKFNMRNIM